VPRPGHGCLQQDALLLVYLPSIVEKASSRHLRPPRFAAADVINKTLLLPCRQIVRNVVDVWKRAKLEILEHAPDIPPSSL
jgi:hypothetical protein